MPTPRKPASLRAIHGQPPRVAPIAPPLDDDRPPAWLPREGKVEWRRIMGEVNRAHRGHVAALDRVGLTVYCSTWATWVAAARDVAKRGPLVPGRSSADQARGEEDDEPAMVKNPSVQIQRDAGIALQRWCREFGFTPSSRQHLDIPRREPNPAERLLS